MQRSMPVCMVEPCFLIEASDGAALAAVEKSAGIQDF